MNLTEKSISRLKASAVRQHFYDDELTGFGVRVESLECGGRKSFFWRAKVNRQARFRALGEFPALSVSKARDAARSWIGKAAVWKQSGFAGEDPFEISRSKPTEPASVPTFRELTEAYVVRRVSEDANRPEKAEYHVRWLIKKHFAGWLDRRIDTITVADVLTVKNACGKHEHMANRCVEFIRALFNWSAKAEDGKVNFWCVENPAKDVSLHDEKPRERFLEPQELGKFNEALKSEPDKDLADFITLALNTGARKSDILSMRWADVQWERLIWRVPFPKNGESYDVALLPVVLEILKRRHSETPDSEKFVFPSRGASGHVVDFKKRWDAFRKRAGVADLRIHDLRRTCGSYLTMSGVGLPAVAAALGHKSLQSVQVYARLHSDSVREARESGQKKMVAMMRAATRRTKLAATSKHKLLAAAVGRG